MSATRTCSYCGRENDRAETLCRECGTDFSQRSPAPPRDRSVLIRRLRVALAGIGIVGGLLWLVFGYLLLLFHGFKAGGPQGGMSQEAWALCIAVILITFIYYAVVSSSVWTRALLVVGVVVHALWAVAMVCIVGLSGGGFLLTPLFFAGAACWIGYAIASGRTSPQP
jgi:hypothetical protein